MTVRTIVASLQENCFDHCLSFHRGIPPHRAVPRKPDQTNAAIRFAAGGPAAMARRRNGHRALLSNRSCANMSRRRSGIPHESA